MIASTRSQEQRGDIRWHRTGVRGRV